MGRPKKHNKQQMPAKAPPKASARNIVLYASGLSLFAACAITYTLKTPLSSSQVPYTTPPHAIADTQPSISQYDLIKSLPVTYRDSRQDDGVMHNATMQILLGIAYTELGKKEMPSGLGTPRRLELRLNEFKEQRQLLPSPPAEYASFCRDASQLIEYAATLQPDTTNYPRPGVTFHLATVEDKLEEPTEFRTVLGRPLQVYIVGDITNRVEGTISVYGTGTTVLNLDIGNTFPIRGDVGKQGSIELVQGALHPKLNLLPILHSWEGNTPLALDNVLGEYFHVILAPHTVQNASKLMARIINDTNKVPQNPRALWEQCLRHYDVLEEATAHALAHHITPQWLTQQTRDQGELGANYPGTKELQEYCSTVGVAQLMTDYMGQSDRLIQRAGLKHTIKD